MTRSPLPQDLAVDIYRTMTRIDACNRRIEQLLAAGALQFQYYPCGGQEAIPAAIAPLLQPDDEVVTTYRGVHDIVAKGTPMTEIIAEMMGKPVGTIRSRLHRTHKLMRQRMEKLQRERATSAGLGLCAG